MFYHRFVLSFENEAKKQRRKNEKMQKLIRATVNMKSHVIILYTTMYKCESSSRFPNKTSLSLSLRYVCHGITFTWSLDIETNRGERGQKEATM